MKHKINWRLKLVVETFEHSTYGTNQSKFTKAPKVVKPTNKNYKTFGTFVFINPYTKVTECLCVCLCVCTEGSR